MVFLDVSEFLRFCKFFPFFKKNGFLGFLGPPSYGIGTTIRIGQEMLCHRMREILLLNQQKVGL